MQTRPKTRSNNPKLLIATCHPLPSSTLLSEPTCSIKVQKDPKGRQATVDEYNALSRNCTRTLTPPSSKCCLL